ncbi:MAG: F0F1 ATP synthase subunit B [Gammaproteobacteria bacterium]|nr:F0F1 ATP synthase subunit B [Gammaproteobacteria bacterium]MDH5593426.1 F0F1 ATP synthase subunit B [Gammaproteobacteria bacterium]MDH5613459.1 F0F1 ATP synthase subunit B [Gammaproteobacteria bacterium]
MNINLTLIGQSITFFFFVLFCMKLVWPPIMRALDERKKTIADGLAAAERGKHEQELAQNKAKDVLKEAKEQAGEIIAHAQKRASEIIDEAKNDARAEGERILTAARAEINQEANQAKEILRGQVVSLAVAGASKVLEKEINEQSHSDMLEKLASQI